MISNLRERMLKNGNSSNISFSFLLAIFLLPYVFHIFESKSKKKSEGIVVNDIHIPKSLIHLKVREFNELMRNLRSKIPNEQFFNYYVSLITGGVAPDEFIIRSFINNALLEDLATQGGIRTLHPSYVKSKLSDIDFMYNNLGRIVPTSFFDNSGLNRDAVFSHLSSTGNFDDFEKVLEGGILSFMANRLLSLAIGLEFSHALNKVTFDVFTIEVEAIKLSLLQEILSHESAIRDFYESRKETLYKSLQKRVVNLWEFKLKNQEEAEKLRQELKIIFSSSSKQNKLDSFIKKNNGLLREEVIDENSSAPYSGKAFQILKKDGYTYIVHDNFIWILQLLNIEEARVCNFNEVEIKVKEDYLTHYAAKEIDALIDNVRLQYEKSANAAKIVENTPHIKFKETIKFENSESMKNEKMKKCTRPGISFYEKKEGRVEVYCVRSCESDMSKTMEFSVPNFYQIDSILALFAKRANIKLNGLEAY